MSVDVWPGSPEPLGVTPSAEGVNVALWSEEATAVDFCLVDRRGREVRYRLPERTGQTFHGFVPGVGVGETYGFRVHGPWDPEAGQRFNPAKLLVDPYARAITRAVSDTSVVVGHRADDPLQPDVRDSAGAVPLSVVTSGEFDWGDDRAPMTPWSETVIYEAHVRGLTMRHPAVPPQLRGTYGGVGHPALVDHLRSLGVTAVELLPVHHIVPELSLLDRGMTNYWGYNSIGYFAPHAGYSAFGEYGSQVVEFKSMVRNLHAAGLEVILDVVYNHTAEGGSDGPTLCFRGIDNQSYYRLTDDNLGYVDYTGTGNTLNVPRPHTLRLIMDSLRYWVTDMHVDGFRFDLASALARSLHDVDMLGTFMTTLGQDPVLRSVKLIAEPWDVGAGGYQVGEFPSLWREWNDKFRDTVRDFWRGDSVLRDLGWRLSGSADLYQAEGRHPQASVNFVTAHDGFTLRDLVSYEHKHNEANGEANQDGSDNNRSCNYGAEGETADATILAVRRRQLRNLLTTLLLSTGVPMLTAGDEMGRTQQGNNNAYCQDNEISWLDWELDDWQLDLLAFTQRLAAIRRTHAVLRQRTFFTGSPVAPGDLPDLVWLTTSGTPFSESDWGGSTQAVGMFRYGRLRAPGPKGEAIEDDSILLLLNADTEAVDFELPGLPYANAYVPLLDTASAATAAGAEVAAGTVVRLEARSARLLSAALPTVPAPTITSGLL